MYLHFFISDDDLFSGFEVVAEGQENYVSVEWFLEKPSEKRKIESVMFFWCHSESFHVGHCKVLAFHRSPLSVRKCAVMFVLCYCGTRFIRTTNV